MNTPPDLSSHPGAVQATKQAITIEVHFACKAGVCTTPEGPVSYRRGDPVLTGTAGEHWPIEKEKFKEKYEPCAGTIDGEDGQYCSKTRTVHALCLKEPISVPVGWRHEPLHGKQGDWLVQYGPDDYGIVDPHIFATTYRILEK